MSVGGTSRKGRSYRPDVLEEASVSRYCDTVLGPARHQRIDAAQPNGDFKEPVGVERVAFSVFLLTPSNWAAFFTLPPVIFSTLSTTIRFSSRSPRRLYCRRGVSCPGRCFTSISATPWSLA